MISAPLHSSSALTHDTAGDADSIRISGPPFPSPPPPPAPLPHSLPPSPHGSLSAPPPHSVHISHAMLPSHSHDGLLSQPPQGMSYSTPPLHHSHSHHPHSHRIYSSGASPPLLPSPHANSHSIAQPPPLGYGLPPHHPHAHPSMMVRDGLVHPYHHDLHPYYHLDPHSLPPPHSDASLSLDPSAPLPPHLSHSLGMNAPPSTMIRQRRARRRRKKPVHTVGDLVDRLSEFESCRLELGSKNAACAAIGCSKGTIITYTDLLRRAIVKGLHADDIRNMRIKALKRLLGISQSTKYDADLAALGITLDGSSQSSSSTSSSSSSSLAEVALKVNLDADGDSHAEHDDNDHQMDSDADDEDDITADAERSKKTTSSQGTTPTTTPTNNSTLDGTTSHTSSSSSSSSSLALSNDKPGESSSSIMTKREPTAKGSTSLSTCDAVQPSSEPSPSTGPHVKDDKTGSSRRSPPSLDIRATHTKMSKTSDDSAPSTLSSIESPLCSSTTSSAVSSNLPPYHLSRSRPSSSYEPSMPPTRVNRYHPYSGYATHPPSASMYSHYRHSAPLPPYTTNHSYVVHPSHHPHYSYPGYSSTSSSPMNGSRYLNYVDGSAYPHSHHPSHMQAYASPSHPHDRSSVYLWRGDSYSNEPISSLSSSAAITGAGPSRSGSLTTMSVASSLSSSSSSSSSSPSPGDATPPFHSVSGVGTAGATVSPSLSSRFVGPSASSYYYPDSSSMPYTYPSHYPSASSAYASPISMGKPYPPSAYPPLATSPRYHPQHNSYPSSSLYGGSMSMMSETMSAMPSFRPTALLAQPASGSSVLAQRDSASQQSDDWPFVPSSSKPAPESSLSSSSSASVSSSSLSSSIYPAVSEARDSAVERRNDNMFPHHHDGDGPVGVVPPRATT